MSETAHTPRADEPRTLERDDLFAPPVPPAKTDAEQELAGVIRELGLERDDYEGAPWYLPAEPSPIECATVAEAVQEALRLSENDGRRDALAPQGEGARERIARELWQQDNERFAAEMLHKGRAWTPTPWPDALGIDRDECLARADRILALLSLPLEESERPASSEGREP